MDMTLNSDKRARLEDVIRALLEKTLENGCTEHEAMHAAEKAQELIERYQIEIGTEELKKEGVERVELDPSGSYEGAFFQWAVGGIGRFCEVKVYTNTIHNGSRFGKKIWYGVGLKSDLEFFRYLVKSLTIHALTGATHWAAGQQLKGGQLTRAKTDFIKACGHRIRHRLFDMVKERDHAKESGSRAVVLIDKKVMISDWFSSQGIHLGRGGTGTRRDSWAGAAGAAHGDSASFGRPVGSSGGAVALIGRS